MSFVLNKFFCANCVFSYSPCVPVGVAHENCVFCRHSGASGWDCCFKIKKSGKTRFVYFGRAICAIHEQGLFMIC